ncbi:MAG: serine/threonine-protein kinase, partial [Polyangiaceae bacterium]
DHVARVLDVGTVDGIPYMVLEYLDGEDLEQLIERRGLLPVAEIIDLLLEAIEGVAHAHALGIVHRDLKPSNLFLAKRQDGTARVKVLDFGISKMADAGAQNVTRTNSILGSPLYMSPEQLRSSKDVDQRCDIWAFGVILYQLLTGAPPFMGDNAVALFAAIQESDPPTMLGIRSDAAITAELEATVLKCLKRKPADRFASLAELAVSLAPFATSRGARTVENTARILGGPQNVLATIPDVQVQSGPAVHRLGDTTVDGRQLQTIGSWADAASGARKPKRSPALYLLFALPLIAVVGGLALFLFARRAPIVPATVALPPVTSSVAAASSVGAAPSESAALPPAPTEPVSAASSEPVPTATPTPTATTAPKPKASATPHKPKTGCNPPYEFDATGKKHWKTECL